MLTLQEIAMVGFLKTLDDGGRLQLRIEHSKEFSPDLLAYMDTELGKLDEVIESAKDGRITTDSGTAALVNKL